MNDSKVNLSINVNGITFENPFILASAPPTATGESIRKAFKAGWAGVVVKTIRPESVFNSNVTPRFGVLKSKGTTIGFQNIEMLSEKSIEYWVNEISQLKKEFPTKVIIASIMGDTTKESWQEVARAVIEAGSDAIELNFSCPNGVPKQGLGLSIGQDPKIVEMITEWVKEVSNKPVIVKLTPNITDITVAARAAVSGGADGIAAINTVSCLIGVDVEKLSPSISIDGATTYGGYSGIAVKPIGLRCVSEIANAVEIPVYGMGGISTWSDAIEYMALGAPVVQVCTEVMLKGFDIIKPMLRGLEDYMIRKGFNNLEQIIGILKTRIKPHTQLSRDYIARAVIEKQKCTLCTKCSVVCSESGYQAIVQQGECFEVQQEKCDGCALCTYVCPKDAISMCQVQ